MTPDATSPSPRRADAERNRERILATAREAFAETGASPSMAEIARRAGVGMATLYRNFPGRQELLEALYVDEVDAVCAAAETVAGATPGERFEAWVLRFTEFIQSKHAIATELLKQTGSDDPVFDGNRARVLAAGGALLQEAQSAGDVRDDLDLVQVLDMVIAVSAIRGDAAHRAPILRAALDGLRPPGR